MNKLELIGLASQIWGRKVAQGLWTDLGLPMPGREGRGKNAREDDGGVGEFLAARTAPDPRGRIQARTLFSSYLSWASGQSRPALSERGFAMAMARRGAKKEIGRKRFYLEMVFKE